MDWILWIIAVAILGFGAVLASGRLGELSGTVSDTFRPAFPQGDFSGADLRKVQFGVVLRGYSMDQVDQLISRLSRQLEEFEGNVAPISADELSQEDTSQTLVGIPDLPGDIFRKDADPLITDAAIAQLDEPTDVDLAAAHLVVTPAQNISPGDANISQSDAPGSDEPPVRH